MLICLCYVLYCAATGKYDWSLLIALSAVAVNGLSIAINHFECPLTSLAKKLGDPKGSITDIILPDWCARHVFNFFIALSAVAVVWLGVGYFS